MTETDIAIFDDRIEIWSASKLPERITVSDLLKPHVSVLRNPTLANLFFLTGDIEKFGTGIKKMIDACRDFKMPPPDFDSSSNAFCVTFRKFISDMNLDKLDLNARQRDCIEHLKEKGRMTASEYSLRFNVSARTSRRDISSLVKLGIVEEVGEANKRYYSLKRQ
jgi:ATP-dependent DNA helicase RecG